VLRLPDDATLMKWRSTVIALCASVFVLGVGGFALGQHLFDAAILALREGNCLQAASRLKPLGHLGDSQARDLLGDMYAFGWGVQKDDSEAIKWYRRAGTGAADLRDRAASAMYFVGKRYQEGDRRRAR
jgi:TPR repeat protein